MLECLCQLRPPFIFKILRKERTWTDSSVLKASYCPCEITLCFNHRMREKNESPNKAFYITKTGVEIWWQFTVTEGERSCQSQGGYQSFTDGIEHTYTMKHTVCSWSLDTLPPPPTHSSVSQDTVDIGSGSINFCSGSWSWTHHWNVTVRVFSQREDKSSDDC